MKSKVLIISLSIIALFAFSAHAQNCPDKRGSKGKNPQKAEMNSYFQENIFPVLKIQREELDEQLSQADKSRLAEIRPELKSMRTITKEKHRDMRDSQEKPTVEQRKEMREQRNKMHELMNEVGIMTEKYDAPISSSLESIRENAETWRSECREHQGKPQMEKRPQNANRNNKPRKGYEKGGMMKRLLSPEGFLLWDPNEPMPFADKKWNSENSIEVNLFPNPASESVQVSLTLQDDETVFMELMDKDGQLVLEGKQSKTSQGIYTQTFDVSKFKNGIYFIKIKVDEKTSVKRLIIQK